MFSKLFVVMTAVLVAVNAQSSGTWTSAVTIPTFDTCTAECLSEAATRDGCVTFTNVSCVCTNQQFIADSINCIFLDCGMAEVTAAQMVQSMGCAAAGLSATGPSATPVALPFGQGTDTSDDSGTAPATGAAAATTSAVVAAASGSASTSSAGSVVANGGVAAMAAMAAALLAL